MNKSNFAKNLSFLWLGSLLGATCSFLLQMSLARELGPHGFGLFGSVFALVTLLVPFAGFGVAQYWLKEFGREGRNALIIIQPSFNLVLMNFSLIMLLLSLWAIFGPHGELERTVILVMGIYISGQVSIELVSGKLQLEERYGLLALWQFMPHAARLLLLFLIGLCISEEIDVKESAYIFASVALVIVFLNIRSLLELSSGDIDLKGHSEQKKKELFKASQSILETMKGAAPFGFAGIFHLIYFQSDIILVKYMVGIEPAGFYNVAFTVMVAVLLFPSIVYQKYLLPKMHRWAHYDRALFRRVYRTGNIIMLFLGTFAFILIFIFSPIFVAFIFGDEYQDTVFLLRILAMSSPILFVASSVGATLVTQEHMKKKVKIMGLVAMANIVLNVVLIPHYGAAGAALATVLSNFLLLAFFLYAAQKYIFNLPVRA